MFPFSVLENPSRSSTFLSQSVKYAINSSSNHCNQESMTCMFTIFTAQIMLYSSIPSNGDHYQKCTVAETSYVHEVHVHSYER